MSKAFKDEQSRERDIYETLICIIQAADPKYVRGVSLSQFTQGLIDEVRFLLPGDEEDMRLVEHYIHQHQTELYQRARA